MLHALARLIISLFLVGATSAAAEEIDSSNCGSEDPRYTPAMLAGEPELPPFDFLPAEETSRIDLIVFYTPQARQSEGAGTTDAILARINTAKGRRDFGGNGLGCNPVRAPRANPENHGI